MSEIVFASYWVHIQCSCMIFSLPDPPDVAISSATADWFLGLEKAELICSSGGFPKPENVTWKRYSQLASNIGYELFASV